jgi:hypothetical protein
MASVYDVCIYLCNIQEQLTTLEGEALRGNGVESLSLILGSKASRKVDMEALQPALSLLSILRSVPNDVASWLYVRSYINAQDDVFLIQF